MIHIFSANTKLEIIIASLGLKWQGKFLVLPSAENWSALFSYSANRWAGKLGAGSSEEHARSLRAMSQPGVSEA